LYQSMQIANLALRHRHRSGSRRCLARKMGVPKTLVQIGSLDVSSINRATGQIGQSVANVLLAAVNHLAFNLEQTPRIVQFTPTNPECNQKARGGVKEASFVLPVLAAGNDVVYPLEAELLAFVVGIGALLKFTPGLPPAWIMNNAGRNLIQAWRHINQMGTSPILNEKVPGCQSASFTSRSTILHPTESGMPRPGKDPVPIPTRW
jgi:hypothetical protein